MFKALGNGVLTTAYEADLGYKGQALTLSIPLLEEVFKLEPEAFAEAVRKRFDAAHEEELSFCLPSFALEVMRLGIIVTDGSLDVEITFIEASSGSGVPPSKSAIVNRKMINTEGERVESIFRDRDKFINCGYKVQGPVSSPKWTRTH